MNTSTVLNIFSDTFRSAAAALFAVGAMTLSVSALAAFTNPAIGILLMITYLPLALLGAAPIAICLIVVGLWLRKSAMRFLALVLAGAGSGAASGTALSTKLLPAGQLTSGHFWLVVLGSIGGVVGACVFAYLTPRKDSCQPSEQ